jgi:hypothetical protein
MLIVYNGVAKFRQAGKSAVFAMCSFLDSSFSPLVASRPSLCGRWLFFAVKRRWRESNTALHPRESARQALKIWAWFSPRS